MRVTAGTYRRSENFWYFCIMSKRQEIKIHVVFWVLFLGMDFYFDSLFSNSPSTTWSVLQEIAFDLLQLLIFYLNYSWICKKTMPQKKWTWLVLGQLLLLFIFPVLRNLFEEVIIYKITGFHNYKENYRLSLYYFYDNSFYAIRIVLLSLIFFFTKEVWDNQKKMNALVLRNKQAQLENLKSQLSPHFLFNTLNSFYADLMDKKPQTADDIMALSDMLRYITYENESGVAYLTEEIQFLQNYITLFSRRFDHKLAADVSFPDKIDEQKIPASLLIHFVENAFKHGINTDSDKPVKIDLSLEGEELFFTVENYYEPGEHYDTSGIGYTNVEQRLALIYEDNYTLDVHKTDELYAVELQIPLIE